VLGPSEDFAEVLVAEVRTEQQETREVKLTRCDGLKQHRKAPNQAGCGHPTIGFVFGETEVVDAVGVEAGTRASAVQATCFEFTQVREE
jgi:hypothetical protein